MFEYNFTVSRLVGAQESGNGLAKETGRSLRPCDAEVVAATFCRLCGL
jgi:hypothetical protein